MEFRVTENDCKFRNETKLLIFFFIYLIETYINVSFLLFVGSDSIRKFENTRTRKFRNETLRNYYIFFYLFNRNVY